VLQCPRHDTMVLTLSSNFDLHDIKSQTTTRWRHN